MIWFWNERVKYKKNERKKTQNNNSTKCKKRIERNTRIKVISILGVNSKITYGQRKCQNGFEWNERTLVSSQIRKWKIERARDREREKQKKKLKSEQNPVANYMEIVLFVCLCRIK